MTRALLGGAAALCLTGATCGPARAPQTPVAEEAQASSAAPGNPCPAGRGQQEPVRWQRATLFFVDALRPADLEWVCSEGFRIEAVFAESSGVRVRVPPRYAGDPRRNARVRAFDVEMR